jgi:hypothetical protein
VTQSSDLSKASRQTLDTTKSKAMPEPRKVLPADAVGPYDLFAFFGYADSDAQPGLNILTITGLPPQTWIALASPTEITTTDATPHVGAANFNVQSIELDTDGQFAQVIFNLDWQWPLPYGAMTLIGYLPG